nr:PREDICTED: tripartite motif-containing protein 47-like isoform X4 [Lepisosteus oculatus]
MAEASICITQDQFSCSICLDVLRDPVTLPCGHSYCVGCIKSHWDLDDRTGVYSCPQCRQTFTPRPVLGKNTVLAEVVEKLKETGLSGPSAPSPSGPGDVLCDVCTGSQVRAVKSCLVCLASYCQTHLQPHCEAAPLKRHQLVEATRQLDRKLCSRHSKLLEVYCRTDRTCVCLMCTVDDHRGHDIIPAAAERTERQKKLEATQRQTQQRLQEREKELQELRQAVDSLRSSAQRAVEDSDRIFSELDRSVKRMRHAVAQLIQVNQQAAEIRGAALLERLEQEIAELRRRDAELSQLSHTEDHIHFLQSYKSFCGRPAGGDVPNISVNPDFSFGVVKKSVLKLKRQLEDIWKEESVKISRTVNEAGVYKLKALQPRTRAEFLH